MGKELENYEEVKYDFEYIEEANFESSVRSYYVLLWDHLLKYKFNTPKQSTSWLDSINKSINLINDIRNNKSINISNTWKNFVKNSQDCEKEFNKAIKEAAKQNFMDKRLFYRSLADAISDEPVFDPINALDRNIVKQYLLKYYDPNAKDSKDVIRDIEAKF